MNFAPTPLRSFIGVFLIAVLCAASAPAAVWYLDANQTSNSNTWNTLSNWNSSPAGNGTDATALSGSDTYSTNGKTMRTPNSENAGNSTQTFAGGTLALDGGTITLKSRTAIVNNLTSSGGIISNGTSSISNSLTLEATTFTVSGLTTLVASSADRTTTFNFATLSGAGGLTIQGLGNTFLNATTATGYTGALTIESGLLDFSNNLATGGAFVVESAARVKLDQNLTFSSLSIAGNTLTAGTYSYTYLSTTYATIFGTSTAGSITVVPEPGSVGLVALSAGIFGYLGLRRRSRCIL